MDNNTTNTNTSVGTSSFLKNRKVLIALPVILLFVIALFALTFFGIVKNPFLNLPAIQKGPKVSIKTEYKNPFDKKTQYINPFEKYKNPFAVAK